MVTSAPKYSVPTLPEIIEEGKKLAAIHPNIVVKVPMIKEGVKAIKWFTDNGIRTNCTLIFSAGQAILAAKAGATYVSPFIGRIDDSSWDGVQLIEQIAHIYTLSRVSKRRSLPLLSAAPSIS
jgi:transaldolase